VIVLRVICFLILFVVLLATRSSAQSSQATDLTTDANQPQPQSNPDLTIPVPADPWGKLQKNEPLGRAVSDDRPIRQRDATPSTGSQPVKTTSGAFDLWRVAGALGIVIGLILVLKLAGKKVFPGRLLQRRRVL